MASNQAAWLTEAKKKPLKVDGAPQAKPGPDEVVIQNKALAINPVDWKMQDYGFFIQSYPAILGTDVSGVVHEVGPNVKHLKQGDRVLGHAIGLMTGKPEHSAFQLYTTIPAVAVAKLPSNLSFAQAAVLPLAISTASAGLYPSNGLGLPYPQTSPKSANKVIVIWGGASSIGSTAIQLAVASGVKVITTASKRNHSYASDLGASTVVDYNDPAVIEQIVEAIKASGADFAGIYDSISEAASFKPVFEVAQKAGGNKKVITVLPAPEDKPADIDTFNVFAPNVFAGDKAVGSAVWQDFVPAALANGTLRALPNALVVGKGLEDLQKGLDTHKAGVSANKVVVEL